MNGHVRKRGKKYSIVLYLGRDESGRRKQKWIGGFETKKDAEKALAEKLHDMYRGVTIDVSTDTVADYLADWLTDKESKIRPSTYRSYEWLLRDHLIPQLGPVKLAELKPQHLQRLYSNLLKQDKPLSKRSVHHLHGIIRQALKRAVKWDLVGRNVADGVDPPRPEDKEMEVWTKPQVRQFLDSSVDDRFFAVYILASSTGMRKGEILGLRWEDIDFDNNRLQIQRALQWSKGKATFVPPKTQKSKRTVTLPPTVTSVLRTHKARQNEYKRKLGPLYKDQGLLFTALDGSPVQPRVVDEHWYRGRNAANVPKIRFHDLRHTHASLLLELGVHPKVVSERLGSREKTTYF